MYSRLFSAVFIFFLMLAFSPAYAEETGSINNKPFGNPSQGRQLFIHYQCFNCHRVARDPDLPAPKDEENAPVLDPYAPKPESMLDTEIRKLKSQLGIPDEPDHTSYLVDSILSPNHTIAPGFGEETPENVQESKMHDYSRTMTIQDLKDIVAYLLDSKAPSQS